ncbi:hypothetical protein [Candidatus Villigracilis saccharophilus]
MLRAKQVSFQYPQEGHGLPPVSLDVAPGRLTLVTGPCLAAARVRWHAV